MTANDTRPATATAPARSGAGGDDARPPTRAEIRRAAREALGHERLLPGQAEAVAAVASGRDTLALLPTGGGKSAIYQLAGLEIDGPTIVVSPLIALQQDQLRALDALDLPAAALSSAVPERDREAALEAFGRGEIEFLLLAPEQLAVRETLDRLRDAGPTLFVVDEAHCVSEWGRDFRPEYARLGGAAEELGDPPILALTATAAPPVRDEIIERLGLEDPVVVARGFDRPNIALVVETYADADAKRRALVERTVEAAATGAGIVYVATRRAADEIADVLRERGIAADPYHAGLGTKRREEVQDAFMRGDIAVVVATIAFGMGVDKPDVRWVHHLDVSESLDAYHQEIGRGGRDGEPAEARLYYRSNDLALRRFQSAPPVFEPADVRAVLRVIRRPGGASTTVSTVAKASRRSERRTEAIVARLVDLGAATRAVTGEISLNDAADAASVADDVVAQQERRRRIDLSRVEMIRAYAESASCRRRVLLNYFGEPLDRPCGNCDRCWAGAGDVTEASAAAADGAAVALNDRVVHATFGPGLVAGVEGDRVTVVFDDAGYKTLDLPSVLAGGLLRRVE